LELNTAEALPAAKADALACERILGNFFYNAIKFTL